MAILERIAFCFLPVRDYLVPFSGFDAFVSMILAGLMAAAILQNQKRNRIITSALENMTRRYIIFRGHRQAFIKLHQEDDKTKHEILKSISSGWNHFKGLLENYSNSLTAMNRRTQKFLLVIAVLLIIDSFRILISDVLVGKEQWELLFSFIRETPVYFFLVTGFLIIRIQFRRAKRRALSRSSSELDTFFSDMERTHMDLAEEFDPIESQGEEPWLEGSLSPSDR